jgi:hypothetical protein
MHEYNQWISIINSTLKQTQTSPKSSKLAALHPSSQVPEIYPPTMLILEQSLSQCIPSSQWLICSWTYVCKLCIGQRAHSRRIYHVIILTQPSHIFLGNNHWLILQKETNSKVFDKINVSLQSDNPPLKLPFEHFEVCFDFEELLRCESHILSSSFYYSLILWIICLAGGV